MINKYLAKRNEIAERIQKTKLKKYDKLLKNFIPWLRQHYVLYIKYRQLTE